MNFKISFQGISHSDGIENHARKKIEKLVEYLHAEEDPCFFEFHVKAHPNHSHHEISLNVKSKNVSFTTSAENADAYEALDEAVEKGIVIVKKEKERIRDSFRKAKTEKREFES